tara:strand:+ start:119 stop:502 length:384 start_codon:yes stop_codon:yes gene_type:complete
MSILSNKDKYFWFIQGERLGIVEAKTSTNIADPKWESPTSRESLRVHYTAKAAHFTTDMTESSEIPSQFHEALAMKVIADLYKLPGETFNLELAAYFDKQYEMQIREAKKYARRHHTSVGYISPQSF